MLASKLATHKLDLVAVQEVRWDKDSSQPANDHRIFFGNSNVNHH